MHSKPHSHETPKPSSDRAFGFVMAGACAVFGAISWWNTPSGSLYLWLWGIGGTFLLLALVWQQPLKPLNRIWLKFGELLHNLVSPMVMAVMFYLVITPIGIMMRMFGNDLLSLKAQPQADSYWVNVDDQPPSSSMKQQF